MRHLDAEEQHMKAMGYPKLQHRVLYNGLMDGLSNLIEKAIDSYIGLG